MGSIAKIDEAQGASAAQVEGEWQENGRVASDTGKQGGQSVASEPSRTGMEADTEQYGPSVAVAYPVRPQPILEPQQLPPLAGEIAALKEEAVAYDWIAEGRQGAKRFYENKIFEATNPLYAIGAKVFSLNAEVFYEGAEGVRGLYGFATDSQIRSKAMDQLSYLASNPEVVVDGVVGAARDFWDLPADQKGDALYKFGVGALASGGVGRAGTAAGGAALKGIKNVAEEAAPFVGDALFDYQVKMGLIRGAVPFDDTPLLSGPKAAAVLRSSPGEASGGLKLPEINGKWLKGTDGNFGNIPGQVADKLRGMTFNNFDEFRSAFWKEIASDPGLASQFGKSDIYRMQKGWAPSVPESQQLGKQVSYILHHKQPIQHGGGVYNMSNIAVVTPRLHKEILSGAYHFGKSR